MIFRLQLKSSDFQLIPVFKRIEKKQRDLNLKLETWMRQDDYTRCRRVALSGQTAG